MLDIELDALRKKVAGYYARLSEGRAAAIEGRGQNSPEVVRRRGRRALVRVRRFIDRSELPVWVRGSDGRPGREEYRPYFALKGEAPEPGDDGESKEREAA